MVRVKVLQAFEHHEPGDDVDLEPVDAAVKAQSGLVSLLHGQLYSTREMVAGTQLAAATVNSFLSTPSTIEPEPRRRRGRPRKVRA